MRIGLLRHFPVDHGFPNGWLTVGDLLTWRDHYDRAAISTSDFDLGGVAWQACISSDLPRARATASTLFLEGVRYTELLREPQFAPFSTGDLRLPFWAWQWLLRLSWMTGHQSQRAFRDDFQGRVIAVADELCTLRTDTLVVSHAGMMAYLGAELRRRGFSGPVLRIAKHAKAYVYEKNR